MKYEPTRSGYDKGSEYFSKSLQSKRAVIDWGILTVNEMAQESKIYLCRVNNLMELLLRALLGPDTLSAGGSSPRLFWDLACAGLLFQFPGGRCAQVYHSSTYD